MDTIPFLVNVPDKEEHVKGIFAATSDLAIYELPVDRLRENLSNVCQGVANTLTTVKKVGTFKLKEVTIEVEVTAEGGVVLIGTAKLGGKGAITLTFSE